MSINRTTVQKIINYCLNIPYLKKVILILLIIFLGFCIERFKNNYPFFNSLFQFNKLPVYDLQLSDFETENLVITDNQTFISDSSGPILKFSNGININPVKIKSILINAEYSTEQLFVSINALNSDDVWQKEISKPFTNSLSSLFDDNKISDAWYVYRRVTANNVTKNPLVIPCNYSKVISLRIIFNTEPGTIIRINNIIINPRNGILFNFQPIEFLGISFLLILVLFFIFFLPSIENKILRINNLNFSKKPEKIFCIFAFIFGMIFVILIPPFQSPDEHYHFESSYRLSTLHIFPEKNENDKIGFYYPREYLELRNIFFYHHFHFQGKKYDHIEYLKYKNLKLSGEKVFLSSQGSTIPFMHLPQAVGMCTIRLCENLFFLQDANILDIFYAGRLFNLLFYILLGYFSIKIIPIYKYVITAILLLPMAITQAASLNYDGSVISISVFLISILLKAHLINEYQFTKKDALIIIIIGSLIINMKIYFIIFLILPLIKKEKFNLLFNNMKINKRTFFILINCLVLGLSFLLWNKLISNIYITSEGLFHIDKKEDVGEFFLKRIIYLLKDTNYYRALLYDIFENRSYYMEGIVGTLSWNDVYFPRIFITISIFYIVILSICDSNHNIIIRSNDKLVFIFIYLICVVLFATFLYMSYGCFPDGRIIGIQGRYFIPVLPLLCTFFYTRLSLYCKPTRIINHSLDKITFCFTCFSLSLTVIFFLFRYY